MTLAIRSHNRNDGLLLDVPEGNSLEGTQIGLYGDFHGGPNQLWSQIPVGNDCNEKHYQLVSSLDEELCLGVAMNQVSSRPENLPVVLSARKSRNFYNEWIFDVHEEYTIIRLKAYPNFAITNYMDANIVVAELQGNGSEVNHADTHSSDGSQLWYLDNDPRPSDAKPATSCHLTFGPHLNITKELYEKMMKRHGWTLRNTVRVKEVTNSTYFCVVGWGPGGYSGIQQINDDHRVAIFSMWNDSTEINSKVECLSYGDEVEVEPFGGEGCGMKSMKDFWWNLGEEITFIVKGNYVESDGRNPGAWSCSCFYTRSSEDNSINHFMATYRRQGEICPLSDSGFYSFVEDWDRSSTAEGFRLRRCAVFTNPTFEYGGHCNILKGTDCDTESKSLHKCLQNIKLINPSFTKVETGCDEFAKDTANAKIKNNKCKFSLETGGCPKYDK